MYIEYNQQGHITKLAGTATAKQIKQHGLFQASIKNREETTKKWY